MKELVESRSNLGGGIRIHVKARSTRSAWRWGMGVVALAGLGGTARAVAEVRAPSVAEGRALFFREWLPGDARSHGGDGLGPVYNDTSCVACHNAGAPGGAGPASKNVDLLTAAPNVNRVQALEQQPPKRRAGVRLLAPRLARPGRTRKRLLDDASPRARPQAAPPGPPRLPGLAERRPASVFDRPSL